MIVKTGKLNNDIKQNEQILNPGTTPTNSDLMDRTNKS